MGQDLDRKLSRELGDEIYPTDGAILGPKRGALGVCQVCLRYRPSNGDSNPTFPIVSTFFPRHVGKPFVSEPMGNRLLIARAGPRKIQVLGHGGLGSGPSIVRYYRGFATNAGDWESGHSLGEVV